MSARRATAYRARAELRRRVGAIAFVAVLVTLVVGGVLGIAIGERRDATAFDRLVRAGGGPDVLITPGQTNDNEGTVTAAQVRAVPGVARASTIVAFAALEAPDGSASGPSWTFEMYGPVDRHLLHDQVRPVVVSGRLPDPDRADEAIANLDLAERHHLHVGDHFTVRLFTSLDDATGTPHRLRVSGIVRFPDEILRPDNAHEAVLFTSAAFVRAHRSAVAYDLVAADLDDPGADTLAVRRAVTALDPTAPPGFATMVQRRSQVRLATGPITSTMVVFGLVFGLLGVIVLTQTLRRLQQARARDDEVLAALGATLRTRMAIGLLVPAVGLGIGLAGAATLATAISIRFPVGIARRAELHPGLAVNWAWTLGGLAIAATVLGLLATGIAWQVLAEPRRISRPRRPARLAEALWRAGLPIPLVEGARRALVASPRRDAGRGGIAAVALGVSGIAMSVVFVANVQALVHDPARFGWTWDELIEMNLAAGSEPVRALVDRTAADPAVDAVAAYSPLPLTVDGTRVPGIVADQGPKPMAVTLVEGQVPAGSAQVALGGATMHQLGVHLGDRIRLARPGGGPTVYATVVGQVVLPAVGVELMADMTGLGYGVYAPIETVERLTSIDQIGIVIRFAPDATASSRRAALRPFADQIGEGRALRVSGAQRPQDVVGLGAIGTLPLWLAGSLALLVVVEQGLTLVFATRSRRRDLAVFTSMGFVRRQLRGVVVWEATFAAAVAAAAGILGGTALGRWAWTALADELAVAATPVTPLAWLVLLGVAVVATSAAVALVPATLVARAPVATALAGE